MSSPLAIVGAGFVGGALAHSLRDEGGFSLRLATRSVESRDAWREEGFEASALDVMDPSSWPEFLSGVGAVVICVAGGRGGSSSAVYGQGVGHVVHAAEAGAHVFYTSSTGVYAETGGGWVDEDSELDRASERSSALLAAEDSVLSAPDRVGCVLRSSGLVGIGRGPQRRLSAMAGTERRDGNGWLNLVHVDDVVRALREALRRRSSGCFNLSSPTPFRRRDFYDPLLTAAGLSPVRWVRSGEPVELGRRVRIDRLVESLGFRPQSVDPLQLWDRG